MRQIQTSLTGITVLALAPRQSGLTGTERQPKTVSPSSATIVAIASWAFSESVASAGRNAIPTA